MTPDVVFLEPSFPPNQREFVRALHAVGARVTGIGERPKESLDPELRNWLFHYEQIGNVTDVAQVERAVRFVQSKVRVDRLEESVAILKALWSTGKATFEGQHYQLHDAEGSPRPWSQKPCHQAGAGHRMPRLAGGPSGAKGWRRGQERGQE